MDTYLAPEPPDDDEAAADPYGPDSPLAAMAAFCDGLGLKLPPLPEALIPLLQQVNEAVFSTRDDLESLADTESLIEEAASGALVPFVALSHEGYGSNAWYLRYCMALPAAALFVTIPFGGIYMDTEAATIEIGTAFAAAAELMRRALAAKGETVYVIEHRGVSLSRWCEAGGAWHEVADAIGAVTEKLG